MPLNLMPDCELSALKNGMQELQMVPVYQLIRHFMTAKALTSSPPPGWRRIKKSRQKPFIVAFQHSGSQLVIVAYLNLLGENIFIDTASF